MRKSPALAALSVHICHENVPPVGKQEEKSNGNKTKDNENSTKNKTKEKKRLTAKEQKMQ
jgi:hypothetical protein